jgi:hypothetical protein
VVAPPNSSSKQKLSGNDLTMTNNPVAFPVETIRSLFPALHRNPPFIFLDNAAGAQIPQNVLDAVTRHLLECNVQRGGRYAKSQEVDATIERGRQSIADLLNAYDPNEVALGSFDWSATRSARRLASVTKSFSPISITKQTSRHGWRCNDTARNLCGGRYVRTRTFTLKI